MGVALLRFSISDARLDSAIGWNALAFALSAAAGPAIGALIVSVADWHWLDAVNVPIGIAALIATHALPFVEPHKGQLDVVSILLNCAVFGFIVIGADTAAAVPALTQLFLLGVSALVAPVMREKLRSRSHGRFSDRPAAQLVFRCVDHRIDMLLHGPDCRSDRSPLPSSAWIGAATGDGWPLHDRTAAQCCGYCAARRTRNATRSDRLGMRDRRGAADSWPCLHRAHWPLQENSRLLAPFRRCEALVLVYRNEGNLAANLKFPSSKLQAPCGFRVRSRAPKAWTARIPGDCAFC